jgi:stage II sporulation protein D
MAVDECDNGIRITTKGIGHGFGMSLSYARQLALKGEKWQKILKTFYDASICNP